MAATTNAGITMGDGAQHQAARTATDTPIRASHLAGPEIQMGSGLGGARLSGAQGLTLGADLVAAGFYPLPDYETALLSGQLQEQAIEAEPLLPHAKVERIAK